MRHWLYKRASERDSISEMNCDARYCIFFAPLFSKCINNVYISIWFLFTTRTFYFNQDVVEFWTWWLKFVQGYVLIAYIQMHNANHTIRFTFASMESTNNFTDIHWAKWQCGTKISISMRISTQVLWLFVTEATAFRS